MSVGDPSEWARKFRLLDLRFLERVVAVWSACLSTLPSQPGEDIITANLVDLLASDPGARRCFHWIEFQYEPFGYTPSGMAYSLGKVDMAVFLDQDRDTYLAYECKRLNVHYQGRRESLAGKYVTHGLSRFIKGQYSENLPVGCMLGYVLDGDVKYAIEKVWTQIVHRKREVSLVADPQPDFPIGIATRFYSRHDRGPTSGEIEIRHALLPM